MTGFIRIAVAALAILLTASGIARDWLPGRVSAEGEHLSASYRDGSGEVVGTVSVLDVADPWEGYGESGAPADGNRYVGLTLAVSADAGRRLDFGSRSVMAQDTQGRLLSPSYLPLPEGAPMPALDDIALGPGSTIIGLTGYLVPDDATIARLWFAPTWSQLLPFADLQGVADPAAGDLAQVIDAAGATAEVAVTAIEFPFTGFADGSAPTDGTTPMLVTLVFRNTGDEPFTINPNAIALRDRAGNRYNAEQFSRSADSLLTPNLGSVSLAPGDRATGAVGFRLPAGAEPAMLVFEPETNRFMVIGTIGSDSLEPSASPAPGGADIEPQAPESAPPAATMMPPVLATATADPQPTAPAPAPAPASPTAAPTEPTPTASLTAEECAAIGPWLAQARSDLAWSGATLANRDGLYLTALPEIIDGYQTVASRYVVMAAPPGIPQANPAVILHFRQIAQALEELRQGYVAADFDIANAALSRIDKLEQQNADLLAAVNAVAVQCQP